MLMQRVLTATVLAGLSIWALFKASPELWTIIILGIGLIGAWEWSGFAKLTVKWRKGLYALAVMTLAYFSIEYLNPALLWTLTLLEVLVLIGVVITYQRSKGQGGSLSTVLILLLGFLFIPLFTTAMIQFRLNLSPEALLLSLFVIWAIDTGAYFSGRRFGKNKLAEFVSPGKTWEGVYGGVLLAFIIALAGVYLVQPTIQLHYIVFSVIAAIIAVFSVFGDLFESVLKRQADLKDSGSILPGHGGILDRIDSLIVAVPMFYLLWFYGSLAV